MLPQELYSSSTLVAKLVRLSMLVLTDIYIVIIAQLNPSATPSITTSGLDATSKW